MGDFNPSIRQIIRKVYNAVLTALKVEVVNDTAIDINLASSDVSIGGGTEYTEGDTDATITGSAIMFEAVEGSSTLETVNASNPFPVDVTSITGDISTETTLAALNAKVTAADTTGKSTEAKQDAANALLTTISGLDYATQTTLAALLTELQLKADLTETQPVSAASLPLPADASTETTLSAFNTKFPSVNSLSDNTTNPSVSQLSSFGMMFDGVTWDRVRGNSTLGLLVNAGEKDSGAITTDTIRVTMATDDTVATDLTNILADTASLDTKTPTLGQKAKAGSVPVTLASDEDTVNVDVTANTIGLATSANQLPDGHNVTVDNASGGSAVNIQDGGNIITVGGDVAHDSADSGDPVLIGSRAIDYETAFPTAVADDDRARAWSTLIGSIAVTDFAPRDDSTADVSALDNVFNVNGETVNSADVDAQHYKWGLFGLTIVSSGTPDRLEFFLETKDGSNYFKVGAGYWNRLVFEDGGTGTAQDLSFPFRLPPSKTFRITGVVTLSSGSFTVSNAHVHLSG